MNENSRIKILLSLEPAFQIIYWSVCWLIFFILLIVAIETQTISSVLINLGIIIGLLLFFGLGSTLKIKNYVLRISYYRGIKKNKIPLDEIKKIVFSTKREVILFSNQDKKVIRIYLNIRNKKKFYDYIKKNASFIILEEQNKWNELSETE